jgi:polynucleotide 5'-hydroxyl-kinase GRC3/NOL9
VRGPAALTVTSGQAHILGSQLNESTRIVVQNERQLPLESRGEAEIEIELRENGAISETDGSTIPRSWTRIVHSLSSMRECKAMIIGPADAGKSTLCTYLMNELLNRNIQVRVIDADIGQADIGPPTTIASSTPSSPTPTLSGLDPQRMFFVGHTTPSFVKGKVFNGINHMLSSDRSGLTIINTDGWILDSEAIIYKSQLISAAKPDIVIGIGQEKSITPILDVTGTHWIEAETSNAIFPRTRNDRKEIRKIGYRRFLDGSTVHTLKLNEVRIRMGEDERKQNLIKHSSELHNLLVGLLDSRGFTYHIGILQTVTTDYLRVYSRAVRKPIILELGYVKLSRDGSELGFRK